MRTMLEPGPYVLATACSTRTGRRRTSFEAKHVVLSWARADEYRFEAQDWWLQQIRQIADFYLDSEFGPGATTSTSATYRTDLSMLGAEDQVDRQETDTISRLVYGFATAYLLTGDDRYLDAAEQRDAQYLRRAPVPFAAAERGRRATGTTRSTSTDGSERKIFASEFGDDYDAIPCYEQIYALAGPTQTYRITGDPDLARIIDVTVKLFDRLLPRPTDAAAATTPTSTRSRSTRSPALARRTTGTARTGTRSATTSRRT